MKDNFFDELDKNDTSNLFNETYDNILNGTEKNINYFLKLSKVIRIISFIVAIILFFVGLGNLSENTGVFITCLISSALFVIGAILSTPFLEWKAYTLKNLYEINKNKRSK
ncbi:MAG: hypothetical protein IJ565_02940 [Bacilli bacterium]|nr:hypothetical protein [Bacilli bacterium]